MTAFSNIIAEPQFLIMYAIAFVLLYLGIKKQYEPLLLVPIAFGVLLANFPGGDMGVIQADENGLVTEHRSEVGQRTDTHEDNRRQEARLDQHIIDEVHQAKFVCDIMQRHFPDVSHHAVYINQPILIRLNHSHIASGDAVSEDDVLMTIQ